MTWFSRLRNWVTDSGNGIGIRADYHDSEDDNFASGINQCLNIAGLNTPTANISMGNFKLTNAALGTSAADYVRLDQAQTRVIAYAADSVGTDSYAITLSPALAAYAVGQSFFFAAGIANTGAATLNINGLGAKTIKKDYNADLNDGDIVQNQIMHVVYDGTNFQMQTPAHGQMNQSLSAIYAADGGGSDSYAISLIPALSAYATGLMINFKANTLNTGAASLNVNGLGAKTIKKDSSLDLETGDIKASQIVQVIYDGTNFQMISPFSYGVNQTGSAVYAADAGSTDDYVITLTPVLPAYVTGMTIRAKCNTANTGAATINVNSLGVKSIVKGAATALSTGDIQAGQIITLSYDGTNFQMQSRTSNPTVSVPTAYTVVCGGTTSSGDLQTVASVGTSGQVLTSNGAGALPTFQDGAAYILISTGTASSSATIDFTGLSSTYHAYEVIYDNVLPATDAVALTMRVSTDGATYLATNYNYWCNGVDDTTTRTEAISSDSGTYISLSGATTEMGNVANEESSGRVLIVNPSHSKRTRVFYSNSGGDPTSGRISARIGFGWNTTASPITAIRFLFTSGNIANGTFKLYGIKSS